MRALLIILLFTSSVACSFAQVSIGHGFGYTSTMFRFDISDASVKAFLEKGAMHCSGSSATIPVEIKLAKCFALQPELAYTEKGIENSSSRTRLNYGELHVLAKALIGNGPTNLLVFAGPSLGRGLLVTYHGVVSYYGSGVGAADFGDRSAYRQYEFSAIGGIGAGFGIGRSRMEIEARYLYSFTPIYNKDFLFTDVNGQVISNLGNVYNQGFLFQLGYLIPLSCPKPATTAPTP